jgi:hypothetical protein
MRGTSKSLGAPARSSSLESPTVALYPTLSENIAS